MMTRMGLISRLFREEATIQVRNLPPDQALAEGAIEPGIVDLVRALNIVPGVRSIASCHGHVRRWTLFPDAERVPYVLFRAEKNFASNLAQAIGLGKAGGALNYVWWLGGHFYPDEYTEVVWTLKIADASLPGSWSRRKVDADIAQLVCFVQSGAPFSVGNP